MIKNSIYQYVLLITFLVTSGTSMSAQQSSSFKPILAALPAPDSISEFTLEESAYREEAPKELTITVAPRKAKSTTKMKLFKDGKEITTIDALETEFFTKKSFASLIGRSQKKGEQFLIARVSLRKTIPASSGTPSIEEEEEDIDQEVARITQGNTNRSFRALQLKKLQRQAAYKSEELLEQQAAKAKSADEDSPEDGISIVNKSFKSTRYINTHKYYDAVAFNEWRYGGYPLTPKKIVNPQESQDPEDSSFQIQSVQYYLYGEGAFYYKFSNILLGSPDSKFYTEWLNVHQNVNKVVQAISFAELGNMYKGGYGTIEPNSLLAKKYLEHAMKQEDSAYARALAQYYLGVASYEEALGNGGNNKQNLMTQALNYFKQAYLESSDSMTDDARKLSSQIAYYLGHIYKSMPGQKDEKKAEEFLKEASRNLELRSLVEAELAEQETIGSCCGFGIFKKKNKIAPERKSISRKSAF